MTDLDVIERAARLFGVSSVRRTNESRNPEWKPAFTTTVKGSRAVDLMRRLLPFMGQRRTARIYEILATFKDPRILDHEKDEIGRRAQTEKVVHLAAEFDCAAKTIRKIRDEYNRRIAAAG